ncbi:hypothetical protein QTQ03_28475 [Micromonospora sp. WMMA1363]|uniref:hypothetical protein n=1 Tax=Micromonospora sp. WMMA1363 TaxID=3053985 RepID=UPI00259C7651|nr:hypothetical protein [Micromonospora sp. WMMA1363]MDM4723343.1 hypothetical protein [Micromonospora sp. WMMA1363]
MITPTPNPIDHIAAHLTVATDPTAPAAVRENARRTAAELIARHDITPAEARAACGTRHSRLTITTHPVSVADGHGEARASLLIGIAEALRCEGVHQPATTPDDYGVVLLGTAAEVRAARRLTDGIFADIDNAFPTGDPQLPDILATMRQRLRAAAEDLRAVHQCAEDLTEHQPRT